MTKKAHIVNVTSHKVSKSGDVALVMQQGDRTVVRVLDRFEAKRLAKDLEGHARIRARKRVASK